MIEIAMISANIYYIICFFKKAQALAISIRDIQYQVEKKVRAKTNPKSILL